MIQQQETHLNNICFSILLAVQTWGVRPVLRRWSSIFDEMRLVVISVSAAVPAPQQLHHNTYIHAVIHSLHNNKNNSGLFTKQVSEWVEP